MLHSLIAAWLAAGLLAAPAQNERRKLLTSPETPAPPMVIPEPLNRPVASGETDVNRPLEEAAKSNATGFLPGSVTHGRQGVEAPSASNETPLASPSVRVTEIRTGGFTTGVGVSTDAGFTGAVRLVRQSVEAPSQVRVYSVADLVASKNGPCEASRPADRRLIDLITSTVEPASWRVNGGEGTIAFYPLGMGLIVNQRAAVQEQVERVLATLRKHAETQVSVEVRLLSVSDEMFLSLGLLDRFFPKGEPQKVRSVGVDGLERIGIHLQDVRPARPVAVFLGDSEFGRMIQACKEDRLTSLIQAPRITMLNAEPARIETMSEEVCVTGAEVTAVDGRLVVVPKTKKIRTGTAIEMEPVVSADGTHVRLRVNATCVEYAVLPTPSLPLTVLIPPANGKGEAVPFTQFIQQPKLNTRSVAETAVVPDGGTLMLYAGAASAERTEIGGGNLLERIPHVGMLFKNTRRTTDHLIVIVKPRIIKDEPEAGTQAIDKLDTLLAEYRRACDANDVPEARRLAIECLSLDPTCFSRLTAIKK